ncbi:flagellar biosynthetic protein FliR [Neptuniibacter caesariensis]|uniref:Flagellar biosynthetic protein FliR n=1 Tax=Neptuniibacter caesariensis TaxID=207954 RepID=A0A7U8GQQ6_NEPCE|nr:flagellar biosynthetic protein FliR [Neptuniibacter caesariensis]EAR60567.1 flagellar biosynthesis protein [Oceanospirillum sp. MED92] [Neptuniibacter caesariensis]
MLELSILQIEQWVAAFLWPLFRIGSFFMAVPLLGSQLVNARIRLMLALAVTAVIAPMLPEMPAFNGLSVESYLIIAQQVIVGAMLGFLFQVFYQVFVLGGQMIAMQMGLGFASMTDPANGISVVMLGQFYLTLIMMIFVALNGHLIMIEIVVRSFEVLPVSLQAIDRDSFMKVALSGTWMFSAAMLMALPAVTALLVVNMAFGIMSRAAPQLNILAVGFPFTMVLGLFINWVNLGGFLDQYMRISVFVLDYIENLL